MVICQVKCPRLYDGQPWKSNNAEFEERDNACASIIRKHHRGKISFEEGLLECEQALETQAPYDLFVKMFEAQGGRWSAFERTREKMGDHVDSLFFKASQDGWVSKLPPKVLGVLVNELGGGRQSKDDLIQPLVGMKLYKKVGDRVAQGEDLLELRFHEKGNRQKVIDTLEKAIEIKQSEVTKTQWVLETLS